MKKVTVYTAPNCPHSKKILEFLQEKNAEISEKCILKNPEVLDELKEVSGAMAIPVTVVDEQVFIGGLDRRNERRLSRALEG